MGLRPGLPALNPAPLPAPALGTILAYPAIQRQSHANNQLPHWVRFDARALPQAGCGIGINGLGVFHAGMGLGLESEVKT